MTDNSDAKAFSSLELQEAVEDSGDNRLFKFTGLVDPEDQYNDVLTYIANNYEEIKHYEEDLPNEVIDSKAFRHVLRQRTHKYVNSAVKEGNISILKRVVGKQRTKSDISGLKAIIKLQNRLRQDIYLAYIASGMGSGKSDFGLLLGQIYKDLYTNAKIGSNIKSCSETKTIEGIEELNEFLETEGRKMFIFDEASSHASSYQKDRKKVEEKFLDLVKKFRKYKAHLIIIGHTGKDIHADTRRIINQTKRFDFIKKTGKKYATIYESTGHDGEGHNKIIELNNLPPTDWNFDTYENTRWSWENSKTENENKKINKKIERAEEIASEIIEDPEGYISYYKTKDAIKTFRREKIQRKYKINQKVLRLVIDILKDNKKDIEDKIL